MKITKPQELLPQVRTKATGRCPTIAPSASWTVIQSLYASHDWILNVYDLSEDISSADVRTRAAVEWPSNRLRSGSTLRAESFGNN